MEDVQFSEFMKLCGDCLAKRGNYEPAQMGKGLEPRGSYGLKGMEVSPDGLGQFPIKKGLLIGIEKRAFGLPLDDKIHFLNGFSVGGGPALIDLTVDRKNARIIVEPMSGAVPTSGGWPWKLNPAAEILHSHQLCGTDLADGARGSVDQCFGDPGLASRDVQVAGSPIAHTAPTQASQAVEAGDLHGVRISNGFSIRKEMFILKRGEDFLALSVPPDKIHNMRPIPKIIKPVLHLDFADALGKAKKNDNFLHNLLVRHYDVQIVDDPEVLIFTHYGHRNRLYSCKKIFYTQERYLPDWKNCDAAVTSAFCNHPRAYYFPFFAAHRRGEDLVRSQGFDPEKILRENRGFCSYMHKYEDRSVEIRTRFFNALNRRAKVDAFGPARNNTGLTVPGVAGEAKQRVLRRCRFHIAFENRLTPGWTTEKFTDAFEANTVPIYWGDEHALQWFNPEAFINVRKFRNFEECCDYILHLENTPKDYIKMLSTPPFLKNRVPEIYSHERLLEFLVREIERVELPVARRRWFWGLTKWRLVRRDRVHEDGSRNGPPPPRRGFPKLG